MTRAFNWLMPHPVLTLILAVVWMLLQNEISAGMAVFGLILGIIIPWGTSVWWPDTPKGFRLGKMITYSLMVMWDIVVANIEVAWIVLTVPNAKLKPAWIIVPLRLREPCPDCGGAMRIIETFRRGQKPQSRAPPRKAAA